MGNKINYLAIFIAAVIEFVTVRAWSSCTDFTSNFFHHSSINLTLQIESYVYGEKGTSLFLTRVFSNKIIDGLLNYLRFYLQFWDIRFGGSWFSLIGYFGIFAGFYYIFANKKRRLYHWIMVLVILLLPWIEILIEPHISVMLKSIYLWVPFCLFSLYGIYQFLIHGDKKKRLIIFLIVAIVSIWWIALLPYTLPRYCSK
jgi:hypothetical protein